MNRIWDEAKPLVVIAAASWIFGFMGMLGAQKAAQVVGVSLVMAVETPDNSREGN